MFSCLAETYLIRYECPRCLALIQKGRFELAELTVTRTSCGTYRRSSTLQYLE
jgi:hypothetical protein